MRGNTGPKIDLKGVSITLVVALIVVFVGVQVATTVTDEQLEQMEDEEITDTCMGVAGCGGGTWGLIPVTGIAGVLAVIVGYLMSLRAPPDDLQETKQLYVEGEIGILELEERLDDEIDDEQ